MRPLLRALLAAGLGICAAVLVSCGQSNGLLSASEASPLNSNLNAISAAVAGQRCKKAGALAATLATDVGNLSPTVDKQLRLSLAQGAKTVADRASRDCAKTTKTTTSTAPTTVTPDTTTPSTTTTTPTTTTPSTATSTPTSTPTTTPTSTTPTSTGTTPTGTTAPGGAGPGGGGATTP